MADLGTVVLDPHPYNCSLVFGSTTLAAPCDFGSCEGVTRATITKSLKNLLKGFKSMPRLRRGSLITS